MSQTFPAKPMQIKSPIKTLKFIIAGIIIIGAIVFLGVQSFQTSAMYYLTVPEVRAQAALEGESFYERQIRVSGPLHRESIAWHPKEMHVQFHIVEGAEMFLVEYRGILPDTFSHSETVVAEGKYTRAGIFEATTLLVKCPSKYQAGDHKAD